MMKKQKPTMKQRLAIIGDLSIFIRALQDNTFASSSLAGLSEFIEKHDCSGHFFTDFAVSELVYDIAHKPSDQAILSTALLIFVLSDSK